MSELQRVNSPILLQRGPGGPPLHTSPSLAEKVTPSSTTQTEPRSIDAESATKDIIRDFVRRSGFAPPHTPPDPELRAELAQAMAAWALPDPNAAALEGVHLTSCRYAETAYGHASPRHRYFVALYTACLVYADDLTAVHSKLSGPAASESRAHALDAVARFGERFVRNEPHPDGALRSLDALLRETYTYWPHYGADAIVCSALDALEAMYVEETTGAHGSKMAVSPSARRFPMYHRIRTGIAPAYTHFNFLKSWRGSPESYVQIVPEIEFWTVAVNDVLSFYKEEEAGETANYIHLRAVAGGRHVVDVLRELADEILETVRRIDAIIGGDDELRALWERYLQGYLTFHVTTPRYRLHELGLYA